MSICQYVAGQCTKSTQIRLLQFHRTRLPLFAHQRLFCRRLLLHHNVSAAFLLQQRATGSTHPIPSAPCSLSKPTTSAWPLLAHQRLLCQRLLLHHNVSVACLCSSDQRGPSIRFHRHRAPRASRRRPIAAVWYSVMPKSNVPEGQAPAFVAVFSAIVLVTFSSFLWPYWKQLNNCDGMLCRSASIA